MARPPGADNQPRTSRAVRDPGDAWVESPTGEKFWGRFGAAGLLVHDRTQGVLLQHRAEWSHFGGTWGIPGGALQQGEQAEAAALREANEEAGVPADAVRTLGTRVVDRQVWRYTTVICDVVRQFEPVVADAESVALAWVPIDEVTHKPLHPAFGEAWPVLAQLLLTPPLVIVVDAANVVGATPNGWWKDRQDAAQKLIERLEYLARTGIPASELGLDAATWHTQFDVIVEGAARSARAGGQGPDSLQGGGGVGNDTQGQARGANQFSVIAASGSGDDAIVEQAQQRLSEGARVIVVTSDRELRSRVAAQGAEYSGVNWLLDMLP